MKPMDEGDCAENSAAVRSEARILLTDAVGASLRPMSSALIFLYLLLTVGHLFALPSEIASRASLFAFASAMVFLCIRMALCRWMPAERFVHALAGGIGILLLANVLLLMHLTREPRETTSLILLIGGAGFLFGSAPWFFAILAGTLGGWLFEAMQGSFSPDWQHFGFALGMSLLLSMVVFRVRLETFRRLAVAQLRERWQRQTLEAAYREGEQVKRELAESGAKFHGIIDRLPEVYYRTTLDGIITMVNPAVERYGFTPEELVGRNVRSLYVDPGDRDPNLKRLLAHGSVTNQELLLRRSDGEQRIVTANARLVYDGDKAVGIEGLLHDVTELKCVEAQLRNAKELAEAANQTKDSFLHMMGHEVRTPLTAIIGFTDILLSSPQPAEQRDCLEIIRRSGDTLLDIINGLLDYGKIEAGKVQLDRVQFDLRDIIEDVLTMLVVKTEGKDLDLIHHVSADVPAEVYGDPVRLRQIFTNLVSNALKFTKQGEIVVRVRSIENGPDTVLIRVEVSDTGIGMEPEVRSRLFQPFVQADASTTRMYGGTGLGLVICKELVKLMGGEIWVESEPANGSTFGFTARLDKPRVEQRPNLRYPELAGRRVLVVDDSPTGRLSVCEHLSEWGMRAESSAEGASARDTLRAASAGGLPFDLVIVDLAMPGMDGMALLRSIRDEPGLASILVVFLVPFGRRFETDDFCRVGAAACLVRPVTRASLYEAVAQALRSSQKQEDQYRQPDHTPGAAGDGGIILIVEDNEVNAEVTSRMLEVLGYRAIVAGTGQDALRALARNDYAGVLMDVQMPDMDGLEVTREIRRRESARAGGAGAEAVHEARRMPIIAVTANAMRGDRERCLAAGMDDYLAKPLHLSALERVVQRWIAPTPISESLAAAVPEQRPDPIETPELLRRMNGNWSLLRQTVETFIDALPDMLAAIRKAVDKTDAQALRYAAHDFKGAAETVGAKAAAEAAFHLEQMGNNGNMERARDSLAELEREIDRLSPALTSLEVAAREQQ